MKEKIFRKSGWTIFGMLSLFIASGTILAAFNAEQFEFKKKITLQSQPTSNSLTEYARVNIDADIYKNSGNLNNIRIIDGAGKEIGYQIVKNDDQSTVSESRGNITDIGYVGGETMLVVRAAEKDLHDRLRIDSGSRNYTREVSVYGSDTETSVSGPGWRLITDSGYIYNIFDDRAGYNTGSGLINFPKTSVQYFKIVIHGDNKGVTKGLGNDPVKVNGVYFENTEKSPKEISSLDVQSKISLDEKNKRTEITLDLGDNAVPTDTIILSTNSTNFSRHAIIQDSIDGKNWNFRADGVLLHVKTSKIEKSYTTLNYPESSSRYIRVLIDNNDNEPLDLSNLVHVKGVTRSVIFGVKKASDYYLYYGTYDRSIPSYDFSLIYNYARSEKFILGTLGNEEKNLEYVAPKAPVIPLTEREPFLLPTLLIILALLIIGLLFYLVKKNIKAL